MLTNIKVKNKTINFFDKHGLITNNQIIELLESEIVDFLRYTYNPTTKKVQRCIAGDKITVIDHLNYILESKDML